MKASKKNSPADGPVRVDTAREIFNSVLETEIKEVTDNPAKTSEGIRFVRRATQEFCKDQEGRLLVFYLASLRSRIRISEKLQLGLERIVEKLSDERMIQSADLRELLTMFTIACDKMFMLVTSIEETRKSIASIVEDSNIFSSDAQLRDLNKLSNQPVLGVSIRKKIHAAYQILITTVGDVDGTGNLSSVKNLLDSVTEPVIEVEPSEEEDEKTLTEGRKNKRGRK